MSLSIQAFDAHVFLVKDAGPQCGPGGERSHQCLSQKKKDGILPPLGLPVQATMTTSNPGFDFFLFLSPISNVKEQRS